MSIILPDGTEIKPREYPEAGSTLQQRKLEACPPDKYIVALATDVILSAEEWLEFIDYDKVIVESMPAGEVHLLRKVEM